MQPMTNGYSGDDGPRQPVGVIRGEVRHADGVPVADATVTVIDPAGSQAARVVGNPDGAFELQVATAGHCVLVVSAEGYEPSAMTVTVGATPVVVDVVLSARAALGGTVSTSLGDRVAAAAVAIADNSGRVVATAESDDSGAWWVKGLPDGAYTVIVTAADCDPAAETVIVGSGGGSPVDVVLQIAAQLTGAVTDGIAGAGKPVAHSQVALLDDRGEMAASALTDEDGRYVFANLLPGDYTVIANGYAPVAATVDVLAGQMVSHEFVLGARSQS